MIIQALRLPRAIRKSSLFFLTVLFVRAFGTFTNGLPSSYTQAATCGIRICLVSDA